jgi:DNA ligase-associated metallophosphoesterase
MLTIDWADESWTILPERALLRLRDRALIITDPHFGKAAAFRHAGVPVPETTTHADLARLDDALLRSHASSLLVLGDFFHARNGRGSATMAALDAWRKSHRDLSITIVRGNHDHEAGDPPADWRIRCVADPFIDGSFLFCHHPCEPKGRFALAGHVHPCVRLHDTAGRGERVDAFIFSEQSALLPAFGSFTGTHPVRPRRGDRVFAVGDGAVIEVTAAPPLPAPPAPPPRVRLMNR